MFKTFPPQTVFRFASYVLNCSRRELRKGGMRIRCQEHPLLVLVALLERPGEVVTRQELREKVWPEETYVDFDHALNTAVKKLRAALNDDSAAPRYVQTVPRVGYRFVGLTVSEDTSDPEVRLDVAAAAAS